MQPPRNVRLYPLTINWPAQVQSTAQIQGPEQRSFAHHHWHLTQQSATTGGWPYCLLFHCRPMLMHTYHHNEVSDLDLLSIVQSEYQLLLPFHRLLMQYPELVLCQNKRMIIDNKRINTNMGINIGYFHGLRIWLKNECTGKKSGLCFCKSWQCYPG